MKYILRSVKYFIYISVLLSLILFVLSKLGFVNSSLSEMFVNGYDSLWQIGLILLVFSAIYPKIGYSSKCVSVPGNPEETFPAVRNIMDEHGYRLCKDEADHKTFVKRAPLTRLLKLYEDTVTVTPEFGGYRIEGITKDIVRLASALDFKFRTPEEDV